MPRRFHQDLFLDDPPPKKPCNNSSIPCCNLKSGEVLKDLAGKQWKLGKTVGVGGFGEIYLASDNLDRKVKTESSYVAKVENYSSGPLFVEINCYLRIAKLEMIEEFKRVNKLKSLGMPHYVASGSHMHENQRNRFLILPQFDKDLDKILQDKKILNLKTVLVICSQIMDVLGYIHSKGFIHSDIKASNLLLRNQNPKKLFKSPVRAPVNKPIRSCRIKKDCTRPRMVRNLRPQQQINYRDYSPDFGDLDCTEDKNETKCRNKTENNSDQVYLLDYGLAGKFRTSDGAHKPFCADERKAHAGTILFCSRDAHKGVFSRRSDLESLGYNIIYWLTRNLPWAKDCDNPEVVEKKKQKAMAEPEKFLRICFNDDYPKFLLEYFSSLQNLQFQEKPDYNHCKKLFRDALKQHGYKNDSRFDFDNVQGWGNKQKRLQKKSENMKSPRFIYKISRPPLLSNIPIRPLLRKKIKNAKLKKEMNWSKILIDPEVILKQARERRTDNVESPDSTRLDIEKLNPTPAMTEVYNKKMDKSTATPSGSNIDHIDGYTPAMMSVLERSRQRKIQENSAVTTNRNVKTSRRIGMRSRKVESPIKNRVNKKSAMVVKNENTYQGRKVKTSAYVRNYALRG